MEDVVDFEACEVMIRASKNHTPRHVPFGAYMASALRACLRIRSGPGPTATVVLRPEPLHRRALALLGSTYAQFYESSD